METKGKSIKYSEIKLKERETLAEKEGSGIQSLRFQTQKGKGKESIGPSWDSFGFVCFSLED